MKYITALLVLLMAPIALGGGTYKSYSPLTGTILGMKQLGVGTSSPTNYVQIKGELDVQQTGTVTVSALSNAVVGSGTSFNSLLVGQAIKIGGQVNIIAARADNTHLTLQDNQVGVVSGVPYFTDGPIFLVTNGYGSTAFSVNELSNVTIGGNLTLGGTFSPGSVNVVLVDTYAAPVTGTTTCDGSGNCTGTGTLYSSELQAGEAIPDPEGSGQFLFVSAITNDTSMTMTQVDPFGFSDLPLTHSALRTAPLSAATVNAVGGIFSMANAGYFTMQAFGTKPVLSLTAETNVDGSAPEALHILGNINQPFGTTKLGNGGTEFSAMGICTIASSTLSTTATDKTCAGVPASATVALSCSGSAAFSTPTGNGVYCRPKNSANTVTCNTIAANTQAMTFTCSWVQP